MYKNQQKTNEEIVAEVLSDFENRRQARLPFEQSWLLNMNFLVGNQYSYINPRGEIETMQKAHPWESREVFNHVAPIIESRLAKLGRVRPSLGVRPASSSTEDLEKAKMSKIILDSLSSGLNLSKVIGDATVWSEVCGTVFYKTVWEENFGEKNVAFARQDRGDGACGGAENSEEGEGLTDSNGLENIKKETLEQESAECLAPDGEVKISVCSPFEIYPESNAEAEIEELASIIHARIVDASEIEETYGVKVSGETMNTLVFDIEKSNFALSSGASSIKKMIGGKKDNQVLLVERWEKPNFQNKNGRLTIVAGDTLVFDGDMPYENYPFVKQVSMPTIGSFWGTSIIDRCIPVQRAYNAIKNRKLECIARLCGGVLAVEDGSVDIDDLEEDGLAPGKILVYRSGSNLPTFMNAGSVPNELSEEEERLKNELISLTGVSELMRNSSLPTAVTSGTAINLLIEQDDTRLSASAENIRNSLLALSKIILKHYKEFASLPKLSKILDDNGDLQIFYWTGDDITSDDVVLETSNELAESISSRKNMVLELLKLGLLHGEDGKLDEHTKAKVIEMLGFGNFENSTDLMTLQIKRARSENVQSRDIVVLEVDNHEIHIKEHTKYILEKNLTQGEEFEKIITHIRMHQMLAKRSDGQNG